jgi:serine/threonine-protein kinase
VNDNSPWDSGQTIPDARRPENLVRTRPQPSPPNSASRCQMALITGSGPCLDSETAALLRYRLKIAATIAAVAFVAFWVFLQIVDEPFRQTVFDRAFHGFVALALTAFATILWSPWAICVTRLRTFELILFLLPALYFAWTQHTTVCEASAFQSTLTQRLEQQPAGLSTDLGNASYLPAALPGPRGRIIQFAVTAISVRWILLIVLYGTFIPSTWRRSAIIVGSLALVPLVQNAILFARAPALWEYSDALVAQALALGVFAAIAIFGSYKFNTLQTEAFEAKKLGQYKLKQRLGAGGMGEVYLGEHILLRRPCAIKVIRPDQAGDATSLQRFEREVRTTATLTHMNTVEIFDYGRAPDGTFYYVMEYLPGLSLEDLVDQYGPLRPERALHLIRQVCGALREAHGIGLLHRDVKPSNILACERGGVYDVAKLLDFGLVRSLATRDDVKLTQEGAITGSPLYLSPEQARGRNNLDVRSDIYSLGGVAYYLLTGQPPFARDSALEALMAHVHDPVAPPSKYQAVPADLQAVVLRCLEKDPEKRFADVDSLLTALDACDSASRWTERMAAAWWNQIKVVQPGHARPEPVAV